MAQAAGGSQSPVDLIHTPLSDEALFSDDLFTNLFTYADKDECYAGPCETAINNIASSIDVHRTAHVPLSKLTEAVEVLPTPVQRPFQGSGTSLEIHSLGRTTSQSQTPPPVSPSERPVPLPLVKPLPSLGSGPLAHHARRQSSLRNEYQLLLPVGNGAQPLQAISHRISGIGGRSERSASPPLSQHLRTTRAKLPLDQFEDPFLLRDHLHSDEKNDECYLANLQHESNFLNNQVMGYSHHVQGEQFTPKPTTAYFSGAPIHGLISPNSLPNGNEQFPPLYNTSVYTSPSSNTFGDSVLSITPLASTPQQVTPPLSSPATNKDGTAPMQPKHEWSSPASHSIPHLHEMTVFGSQDSPGHQATKTLRRTAKCDQALVNCLVTAMRDMKDTEDNPGMLDTWQKSLKDKKAKIEKVCRDMLETIWKAHAQRPETLGEKRPIYVYDNFGQRFDEVCKTLRTQKTVCKHLLEDPYVYQVIDDPVHARKRVQNNRRVNQQKKEAIDEGRKRLGIKGQGKGIALKPASVVERRSEPDDEDQESTGQPSSEQGSEYIAPSRSQRPRRAATKRAYVHDDHDEDDELIMRHSQAPKKARRQTRSKYLQAGGSMADSLVAKESFVSDSSQLSSSPMTAQGVAYTPTDGYHSTRSCVNSIDSHTQYSHGVPSYHNDQGPGHQYHSFSAHTYGSMPSTSPVQPPPFMDKYNPHGYQSNAYNSYCGGNGMDEASHSDHKELPYDPFSS